MGLALTISIPVLYARLLWEQHNNSVLIIADFDEYFSLCQSAALKIGDCTSQFSERGIALALSELTLRDRLQRGEARVFHEDLRESGGLFLTVSGHIERDLSLALPEEWRVTSPISGWQIPAGIPLENIPAGFSISSDARRQTPASWILRPRARPLWDRSQTLNFSRKLGEEPSVSILLSAGEEVLGFPYAYTEAAEGFHIVALPEFSQQRGAYSLAVSNSSKAVRLHTIPPEEWNRYDPDRARSRFIRAVRERSVRLLYLHPLPNRTLSENLEFVDRLIAELTAAGYHLGHLSVQRPPHNPFFFPLMAITTCVLALISCILLFSLGISLPISFLCSALLCFCVLPAGPSALGTLTFSLLIGLCFRLIHGPPFSRWAYVVGISIISGAITAALVQTPALLRGISQPSGIRMSLLIPPVLAFLFSYHRDPSGWARALRSRPLSLLDAFAGLVFLAGLAFIILRAGTIQGFDLPMESRARDLLERLLPARPRFKELLAHPILICVPRISRDGLLTTSLLTAFGALAPASIFNAFLHLHTPLLLTLERVLTGLLIGGITGFFVLALVSRYESTLRRILW